MSTVGRLRFIEFRVVDVNSNPVTGLTLANFTVIFTRDNVACADALNLVDNGTGHYVLEYTPSVVGHDYIELYNVTNDVRPSDAEDIIDVAGSSGLTPNTVNLTQDTGSIGRYKITFANPQTYSVYVFNSQDWQSGLTSSANALVGTTIDTFGNWVSTPLVVLHGTYHIVAISSSTSIVLSAFLQV
jgi:hypothetical protein